MIVLYDNQGKITDVFNNLYKPTSQDQYIVVDDSYIFDIKKYKVENGKLVIDEVLARKEELRLARETILKAFDKYKTNVFYGIEKETEEEKKLMVEWYEKILQLEEEAFTNLPLKVVYYM